MRTKRTLTAVTILFALGLFLTTSDAFAQNVGKAKNGAQNQSGTTGRHFVDADGDGICDNDVDKDGIPNRDDPDFVRPMDGSGKKWGQTDAHGKGMGSKNQGIGPRDGSGRGAKSGNGIGTCNGTGPKGNMNRSSGK